MKRFLLTLWGLALSLPLLNADGLIAPRSLFGPQDDDLLIVSAIKREMGLDFPPKGAFGVVLSQGISNWMALYCLPPQEEGVYCLTLVCWGGLYGTSADEFVRRRSALSTTEAAGIYGLLLKEVTAAKNIPSKASRTDVGRAEYWVSMGGGNVLSGLSISTDDHPEALQQLLYILFNFAKSDDLDQKKWRDELALHLHENKVSLHSPIRHLEKRPIRRGPAGKS